MFVWLLLMHTLTFIYYCFKRESRFECEYFPSSPGLPRMIWKFEIDPSKSKNSVMVEGAFFVWSALLVPGLEVFLYYLLHECLRVRILKYKEKQTLNKLEIMNRRIRIGKVLLSCFLLFCRIDSVKEFVWFSLQEKRRCFKRKEYRKIKKYFLLNSTSFVLFYKPQQSSFSPKLCEDVDLYLGQSIA